MLLVVCLIVLVVNLPSALCWSNGGYSADTSHPDYGTHDWIAQHALDYLPAEEKQYFTDNIGYYLFGTELPDRPATKGGFGDTTKHHIYYSADGAQTDDAAARRAQIMLDTAIRELRAGNVRNAMESAGAMTHYISDMAVFGHVMGASTAWGTESHHQDYEDYVNKKTASYQSSFTSYLSFDGNLTILIAEEAAETLAYNTTFGGANQHGCTWMDQNYDWNSTVFADRCGESLNLAVNLVADALHTLYVEVNTPIASAAPTNLPAPTPTPTVPEFSVSILLVLVGLTASVLIIRNGKNRKAR